jgi:hypothetical protein
MSNRVANSENAAERPNITVDSSCRPTFFNGKLVSDNIGSIYPSWLLTTHDSTGSFTIPGLKDREYDLVVYKRGFQASKQIGGIAPGGPPVAVEMVRSAGDRLRVTDAATGAALRFVRVTVAGASGAATMNVPLDTDGVGEVPRVSSGTYDLSIAWDGYAPITWQACSPTIRGLNVALRPGGQIQVDVRRDLSGYQAVIVYPDESRVATVLTQSVTLSVATGAYVLLLTDPLDAMKVFRGRVTANGVVRDRLARSLAMKLPLFGWRSRQARHASDDVYILSAALLQASQEAAIPGR